MGSLTPGTFGKYEILERIAAGQSTELFKARHTGIGGFARYLAIKRLLPHRNRDQTFVDAFAAEARRAGLLSHANIVQLLDLGQIDDAWFISMEFIDGPDLAQVLAQCQAKNITLPVPHAVFVCIEVLKALEYAHSRQISRGGQASELKAIHRNISPEKILLSVQGEVKLADFADPSTSGHQRYRAPEQVANQGDERSDLYSCGVVLYEMLTGMHPKDTNTAPVSHLVAEAPYSLDSVLTTVLNPDPRFRFATATAMKRALDDFFHDEGFIFSHSTLASFLKGLFPNPQHRRRQALGDRETKLLKRSDMLEEKALLESIDLDPDELPTHFKPPPSLSRAEPQANFPAAESISRLTMPILEESEDDIQLLDSWSEAQTVIQPDPSKAAKRVEELDTTRLSPPPPPPQVPQKPPESLASRLPPPRALPQARPEEPVLPDAAHVHISSSGQRFLVLFTAISVVAMVGMLFLGFFVGSHTAVVRPAQLDLELPAGINATINGQPHDGSIINLEGGRRHTLEISPQAVPDP